MSKISEVLEDIFDKIAFGLILLAVWIVGLAGVFLVVYLPFGAWYLGGWWLFIPVIIVDIIAIAYVIVCATE